MFTRLVKSISVVVLILVLASSVSLAGVGDVHRSFNMPPQGGDLGQAYWSVVLFLASLTTV